MALVKTDLKEEDGLAWAINQGPISATRDFSLVPVGEHICKPSEMPGANVVEQKHHFIDKCTRQQVAIQSHNIETTVGMQQWLDQNEREWNSIDSMFRRRLIQRVDEKAPLGKPLEYPFRKAVHALENDAGERLLADERSIRSVAKRDECVSETLTQVLYSEEFPPQYRVIYFTPIFGSEKSIHEEWATMEPRGKVEVWVVSWQGFTSFDAMLEEVARKVLSFCDSSTTLFYGHSMGAIVAYETCKRLEREMTPTRPVALVVSGCPAPSKFPDAYDCESFSFLSKMRHATDIEKLSKEEIEQLEEELDVALTCPDFVEDAPAVYQWGLENFFQKKVSKVKIHKGTVGQTIINDLKCMQSYVQWRSKLHTSSYDKKVYAPLHVITSPLDDTVDDSDLKLWSDYTHKEFAFKSLKGKDLEGLGHKYSQVGCFSLLTEMTAICEKWELPDKLECLPDIGPTDGNIPGQIDCLVIGAGIAGVNQLRMLTECGVDALCIDKTSAIGGVWHWHGNKCSRVNTSEPAYRIVDQGRGPDVRVNEDHSPKEDIIYDIYTVAAKFGYGKFRLNTELTSVKKVGSGKERYECKVKRGDTEYTVKCGGVAFLINRRLGDERIVDYEGEEKFQGEVYYGYGNRVKDVDWKDKKVMIIGCGAFALENMRTSLEHGALHADIFARRQGTVCPKWIDMIHFYRPFRQDFRHHQRGDLANFSCWSGLYSDSGAPQPACWKEGLLKPNGHTVSVSDLFFIGSSLGMASVQINEIKKFRNDGHGVIMKDGKSFDLDILVKCVGFHTVKEVSRISGYDKMYDHAFMDVNMSYIAEPLLDAGQFASPFGSSYAGGAMFYGKMYAKFYKDDKWQEELQAQLGERKCPTDEAWATQLNEAGKQAIEHLYGKMEEEKHIVQ
jgi:surfactin synthase thioesterase subunit